MIRRFLALAAAAAPLAALTLGAAPAHAASNTYKMNIPFYGWSNRPLCLAIPNNHAVLGQQLWAEQCNGSDEQMWNKVYTDSYHFELQSYTNPNLCANDWQGGDVSGNDIKLYYCNGDADGTWNMVNIGSGEQIQPRSALNNCLNIWGGLAPGNWARLYQCGNVENEDTIIY